MPLKNYKDLLEDLGEVNDASDLINEILNTYEMRKKLLNKLLVSEYLEKTPTVIVTNNNDQIEKFSDIEVLKGILDKVKNIDDDDKRQIVGTTTKFDDFKELLESRELIEKICRVLIENDDFREFFKTSLNEIKMEKPVETSKKGREIKLQFQINNNNNNSDNKCSIGIANCSGNNNNSKNEKYFERKPNQKRKLDDITKNEDTVENQAKKLKSILQNAKIEDADSNQEQQQKYILPKKNASI
jgi:hypothetical protein